MNCQACNTDNREGRRFCGKCGSPLAAPCPACGFVNQADEHFCGGCGRNLTAGADQGPPAAPAKAPPAPALTHPAAATPAAPTAQRRHLTIMFCDMVGSTALSTQMDPEDLRDLIRSFQECCVSEISRHQGFIARYMGDGVLVYFGYPQAHENDAERAVRAGLAIIGSCGKLGVSARVGVATGLAVVGDLIGEGASGEAAVIGETPNLAARLQGVAEPNTVVVAAATLRLLRGMFDADDLGEQSLKGFSIPVRAYRITRVRSVISRFEARGTATALIGRDRELHLLVDRWRTAATGEGQTILLSSEAGLGKSRLLAAFMDAIAHEPHHIALFQGSELLQSSPLAPAIDWLKKAAGITDDAPGERKREALTAFVTKSKHVERLPVLADALGLADEGADQLPANVRKDRLIGALVGQIEDLAADRPTLMVLEDLHWTDPSTQELVARLVKRSASRPLLTVLATRTGRGGQKIEWTDLPHVTHLHLSRLNNAQALALIDALVTKDALTRSVIDRIVARSDGVPLHVEELTRAVLETDSFSIPATLQESLLARLDRIPDARETAQVAAVLGRDFSLDALVAVAKRPAPDLRATLDRLVEGGIILDQGDGRYSFRHALLRDVAYESLLRGARQERHAAAAAALASSPTVAEAQPELVAHHFTEAGLEDEAVVWWRRGAARAERHGNNVEAVGHLERAHGIIVKQAETDERARAHIAIALDRASILRVVDRRTEALAVLEEVEPIASRFQFHDLLSRLHFVRGNIFFWSDRANDCIAAHECALEEGRLADSPEAQSRAYGGLGDAAYARGAMITSLANFSRCVEMAREHGFKALEADNLPMVAWTQFLVHCGSEPLEIGERAKQVAREAGRPRAEVMSYMTLGMVLLYTSDSPSRFVDELEEGYQLSARMGMHSLGTGMWSLLGAAYQRAGDPQRAIKTLQRFVDEAAQSPMRDFFEGTVYARLALAADDLAMLKRALEVTDLSSWNMSLDEFIPSFLESAHALKAWDLTEDLLSHLDHCQPPEPIAAIDHSVTVFRTLMHHARNPGEETRNALVAARALCQRLTLRHMEKIITASIEAA